MRPKTTVFCVALALLALPPAASAKSEYGLRLGESISVQGELAPTLFAGNPCVDVVAPTGDDRFEHEAAGVTEIQADREYWQMVLFADGERADLEESKPSLLLRDLATGEEVRTLAGTVEGNEVGAYMPLSIRFPHVGRWTVAIDDGSGGIYAYSDGIVISTFDYPLGTPLDAAELEELGDPGTCVSPSSGKTDEGSLVLPIVIALGAVAVLGLALRLRRARTA